MKSFTNFLSNLVNLEKDKKDLSLLLACLCSLSVRNEYCQAVVNDGALRCILDLLMDPDQSKDVIRDSLKLVKTLAGNDNVKRDVAESNGIPIVVKAMAAQTSAQASKLRSLSRSRLPASRKIRPQVTRVAPKAF